MPFGQEGAVAAPLDDALRARRSRRCGAAVDRRRDLRGRRPALRAEHEDRGTDGDDGAHAEADEEAHLARAGPAVGRRRRLAGGQGRRRCDRGLRVRRRHDGRRSWRWPLRPSAASDSVIARIGSILSGLPQRVPEGLAGLEAVGGLDGEGLREDGLDLVADRGAQGARRGPLVRVSGGDGQLDVVVALRGPPCRRPSRSR